MLFGLAGIHSAQTISQLKIKHAFGHHPSLEIELKVSGPPLSLA